MLAFHHQLSTGEQRYDNHRAGVVDVFAYCYFAIRHARVVQADVQKVAIINVLTADGRLGEVEGRFGHRFGQLKKILKNTDGLSPVQGLRIIHARQAVAFGSGFTHLRREGSPVFCMISRVAGNHALKQLPLPGSLTISSLA